MDTGIITTVIVLIIGFAIVSRVIGLALRFAVPIILILVLGSAGIFSDLMGGSGRYHGDQTSPYEQPGHRSSGSIGDLRLRDVADIAVDAARSVLQGSLDLLNGLSKPEPEQRWVKDPPARAHDYSHDGQPYFQDDPRQGEARRNW
ncbi:hypothetical protein [Microvirga lenta]|uniref:hypothetical protein n=1 Tax=Microvirga lenta TaxID=2881337 RepID=UPI001CFDEF21|nr:hypothetical protein [Microvirga lenta]MCB5174184.1 hypothetical protein [Microvirga lenta]